VTNNTCKQYNIHKIELKYCHLKFRISPIQDTSLVGNNIRTKDFLFHDKWKVVGWQYYDEHYNNVGQTDYPRLSETKRSVSFLLL
jgi:hypothetical protein